VSLRLARASSLPLPALAALRAAAAREGFEHVERLVREWTSGENRFAAPGEAFFLLFRHGGVAGVGGLSRDPFCEGLAVGRLRRLYVLPSERGRGLGRLLTRVALAHARPAFARVRLRTGRAAAARFYERLGFRPGAEPAATHEWLW
jgi:GNAT superfamily N-acetyltransferase